MQAQIKYVDKCKCTWCEKENEGVEAGFASGFMAKGSPLCVKCFFQAMRVDHKQQASKKTPPDQSKSTETAAKAA